MVEPFVIVPYDVDGTRIVRVAGEIDMLTAQQLEEALAGCNGSAVRVDLAGVTFLDSSGIAVLLRAHERAVKRGAELKVANAASNVLRVFEVTNVDQVLTLETN